MLSWTIISVIGVLLATIGITVDKFLLKRHKNKLYEISVSWWYRLSETRIPNLPRLMISVGLNFFLLIWTNRSTLTKVLILLTSIVLYTFLIILGKYETLNKGGYPIAFMDSINLFISDISYPRNLRDFVIIIFLNLVCDLASISLTIKSLEKLNTTISKKTIFYSVRNLTIILMLSYTMGIVGSILGDPFLLGGDEPVQLAHLLIINLPYDFVMEYWNQIIGLHIGNIYFVAILLHYWITWGNLFLSFSTFAPILIFTFVTLFLLFAKVSLLFFKKCLIYFFERVAEDEPEKLQPFTLTATLLTFIAVFAKTVESLFF